MGCVGPRTLGVTDRTVGVVPTELWRWPDFSMAPGSDTGAGRRVARFKALAAWLAALMAGLGRACLAGVGLVGGALWAMRLLPVWVVIAQAGPAPPCPAGGAGLVAGGEGPPGADLADVRGCQEQRGEDRLGGDAAHPAAGLGEGLVPTPEGAATTVSAATPQRTGDRSAEYVACLALRLVHNEAGAKVGALLGPGGTVTGPLSCGLCWADDAQSGRSPGST